MRSQKRFLDIGASYDLDEEGLQSSEELGWLGFQP